MYNLTIECVQIIKVEVPLLYVQWIYSMYRYWPSKRKGAFPLSGGGVDHLSRYKKKIVSNTRLEYMSRIHV